jgi:hypothetical protein
MKLAVVTYPDGGGGNVSVRRDVELVKAALLYAVTVSALAKMMHLGSPNDPGASSSGEYFSVLGAEVRVYHHRMENLGVEPVPGRPVAQSSTLAV